MLTLSNSLLTLRPLEQDDAAALVDAARDGELWNLPFTFVPSTQTVDAYLDKALSGCAEGHTIPFAVTLTKSGQVIGSTRYFEIDEPNRRLEIGYTWYASAYQRMAVNTTAKLLLLTHAFEPRKCLRVQFTTDVINERSRAAILRLGALEEGVIRNDRIMPDGRQRNSVRYSIIDTEWPSIKANLERRLAEFGNSSHAL